jgi:hypothetical protein
MSAKLLRRLGVAVCLVALSVTFALAQTQTVYVTRTGEKYHRETCRSLAKSKIAMSLEEAAARYGACKVCKPPVPSAQPSTPAVSSAAPAPVASAPTQSRQCQATTKKGTQCKRTAQLGRSYCWQH